MSEYRVEIRKDVVVKTGPREELRVEAEKMIRAHTIGVTGDSFYVPPVIDFDYNAGQLVTKRIANLRGLRRVRMREQDCYATMRRVGAALAQIHELLVLPQEMTLPLPQSMDSDVAKAYIHGDFSLENVCMQGSSESIVIIDWQMSRLYGGIATYGTRFFDVAWFVNNLFKRPPQMAFLQGRAANLAERFLEGYEDQAHERFDRNLFSKYHAQFLRQRLAARADELSPLKRIALYPAFASWAEFVRKSLDEGKKHHA